VQLEQVRSELEETKNLLREISGHNDNVNVGKSLILNSQIIQLKRQLDIYRRTSLEKEDVLFTCQDQLKLCSKKIKEELKKHDIKPDAKDKAKKVIPGPSAKQVRDVNVDKSRYSAFSGISRHASF
jgi:hypothetical protein